MNYDKTSGPCPAANLPTHSSAVSPETMSLCPPEELDHKHTVLKNNFVCMICNVSKRALSVKSLNFPICIKHTPYFRRKIINFINTNSPFFPGYI